MSIEGKLAAKAVGYAIPGAGEVLMAKNAAQGTARLASYGFAMCTFSMFAVFIGTLIGWATPSDSDKTKKQNLFNTWIAFLALFVCCLIIWFLLHKAATYKIAGVL